MVLAVENPSDVALSNKEQKIVRIGKRYYGCKCGYCGKEITRKVYSHHIETTKELYCDSKCANKGCHKPIDINDSDEWLKSYRTTAPKACQALLKLVSCCDCSLPDCNYNSDAV